MSIFEMCVLFKVLLMSLYLRKVLTSLTYNFHISFDVKNVLEYLLEKNNISTINV